METWAQVDGADHFSMSAQRIVDYLNAHTPMSDWSVSRVAGGEQVHVHVHDEGLLEVGQRVPWDETFCIRMLRGASRFVIDSHDDPGYADHPDAVGIRAYAGFPIKDDDGSTFGTLCGVGAEPIASIESVDTELIELMGELLSSQLAMSRSADRERRAAEIAEALAQRDALTGLTNRRGWDMFVADAQQRVDAYADPIAVAVIDLDGLKALNDKRGHTAGDELIRRAANALTAVAGSGDRIARYGGDEFAVLSNNVAVDELPVHFGIFMDAMAGHDVQASMGFASTGPGESVVATFAKADADMYANKQARSVSR
ncbi:diguanylate cyclase (GGDEF)-like protein [Aeromicrobium panaciterrae]|uniref:Diguanylate cyclase (GGDEF)-like protein n=1 Tax=Aeromicrobium panaciterrae TaxID=363861 RepID=A0ABU1UL65_9ACTN|nr:diguanylate cyclase [Aeromicrobium panaciterrae]MDR7085895.1 diguanylate cyclase (GGDEF)-like protein [Aeromicrobium panaciterrae]